MGKRESVKKPRLPRDYYGTVDIDAVDALTPFLYSSEGPTRYVEPCAGVGSLIDLLHRRAAPVTCVGAYDIDPQSAYITQRNCLTLGAKEVEGVDCFITNPPFSWELLQPILDHLPTLRSTWLLLPADSMHNKRMSPYIDFCKHIVSVGRLWWFENDGKHIKGVDNYAWYNFDAKHEGFTKFHPRVL